MDVVGGARRGVIRTADTATTTAGAVGGAVVSGALGAIQGAATGVKNGVQRGGNSSVAAALTIAAVGVVGLVEWPVLVGVGGAALLIHKLGQQRSEAAPTPRQRVKPAKRTAGAGRR